MFERLKNIGFTRQDILVASFLIVTFLTGLIIKYSGWDTSRDFDYSESDRQFERNLKNSFTNLDKAALTPQQQERLNLINSIKDSLRRSKEDTKLTSKEIAIKNKININTAAREELSLLPGIGKSTAERIIEYRVSAGGFKRTEDLMNVKGIGDKKFAKIKDYISVE